MLLHSQSINITTHARAPTQGDRDEDRTGKGQDPSLCQHAILPDSAALGRARGPSMPLSQEHAAGVVLVRRGGTVRRGNTGKLNEVAPRSRDACVCVCVYVCVVDSPTAQRSLCPVEGSEPDIAISTHTATHMHNTR